MKWLHSIRNKPEYIRRQYAVGISVGIIIVIFFLWVVVLSQRLQVSTTDTSARKSTSDSSSPFSLIQNAFSDISLSNENEVSNDENTTVEPALADDAEILYEQPDTPSYMSDGDSTATNP